MVLDLKLITVTIWPHACVEQFVSYFLVFLQDTGVGKSSIVWRFVEDSFDPNINPTIG